MEKNGAMGMKYILLCLCILGCGKVWGDDFRISSWTWSNPDNKQNWVDVPDKWMVYSPTDSSKSFTLTNFVSSGRFCEWRGKHEWKERDKNNLIHAEPFDNWVYSCAICQKKRKVIQVNKKMDEWEP